MRPRLIRHGKSSGFLIQLKRPFFEENDRLLAEQQRYAELYRRQPPRRECKNCGGLLASPDFWKQGVGYAICGRCGHLNGTHEDTDEYCAALYTENGGAQYAETYLSMSEEEYQARVEQIYLPKAQFLFDVLRASELQPEQLTYTDIGAGSGYFIAALRRNGAARASGYEVSPCQASLANRMMRGDFVAQHEAEELVGIVSKLKSEVVSMIGVLEHLQAPRVTLAALRRNAAVKYLYLSVPLFSPCIYLEMVFPSVMPRQLTGGHTHLFTASSLDWMYREYGLAVLGEWWFGTDLVDLLRCVEVGLSQDGQTASMAPRWRELMQPAIDGMQAELDRRHLSSEVHVVLEFER